MHKYPEKQLASHDQDKDALKEELANFKENYNALEMIIKKAVIKRDNDSKRRRNDLLDKEIART